MRLRLNGPVKLDRFSSTKYAGAWLAEGHMITGDPMND